MYLDVKIDNILPITEVKEGLDSLVDQAASTDEMFVITKKGKPAAILVGVHHLEKLTGIDHKEIMPDEDPITELSQSDTTSFVPSTSTTASDNTFLDQTDQQTAAPDPVAANVSSTPFLASKPEPEAPATAIPSPATNPFPSAPAIDTTTEATPAPNTETDNFFTSPVTSPAPVETTPAPVKDSETFTTPNIPAAPTAAAAPADDDFFSFNNTSTPATSTNISDDSNIDDLFGSVDAPVANNVPAQPATAPAQTPPANNPFQQ